MNHFRDLTIGMAVLYIVTSSFLGWGVITKCAQFANVEQCKYSIGTWVEKE